MKERFTWLKESVLCLIFILSSIIVYSQKIFVGLEGGINSTNVISDVPHPYNIPGTGNINSLSGGITIEYDINKWFSINSGLLYDQRGFVYFPFDYPSSAKAAMNYYYLTMPLGVVFKTTHRFYLFVGVGFDPSICIDAIAEWPFEYSIVPVRDTAVTKFDLGEYIEPGLGFQINKRLNVYVSLKARHSFTSITNPNYNPEYIIQSYGFYYQIGIKYGLGKLKD